MKNMRALFVFTAFLTNAVTTPASSEDNTCGAVDLPCHIETGAYHVSLPDNWQGGPAVVHLHGFGGSGAKVIGNKGFAKRINDRGYALIAPSGLPFREKKPNPPDWSIRDGWDQYPRDDVAFLRDVVADAMTRFELEQDRILMSGFSRGGSMVWEVACLAPDTAFAYAPAAGGFWKPDPTDCAGPVKLFHTHGFADGTVPLEGRHILWEELDVTQGDIFQGLQLWRRENGCGSKAGALNVTEKMWRKTWTDCVPDAALELALHPGGHGLPKGWSGMVLDWFEAVTAPE